MAKTKNKKQTIELDYTTAEHIEVEFVCPECGEKTWFTGTELVDYVYNCDYPTCECTGMDDDATTLNSTDRVRISK